MGKSKRKIVQKQVRPALESSSQEIKKTKIRVIGIGGGAGNIVSELAARIKKASFAAANTDSQALKHLNKNVFRFQFGHNLTHGLGTGMNSELARTAALAEKEKIKKLFQGYDFCILISSLGGGAGSGASPIFAREAKNSGAVTLGVFTLPFKFEGEKKQELARESLQKLRPNLSALAVLPNDRIFQIIEKSTSLKDALSFVNENLSDSLEGLMETIYSPGLINIDFADLKTILQGQGKIAYLSHVEIQGANKALEAVKRVLNNPIYPYGIKGAKKVLFNITGGKELSLTEVSEISKMIFEQVFSEAKIIFGISQQNDLGDKIKVSLLATGCAAKFFSNGAEKTAAAAGKRKRKKRKPRREILPPEPRRKSKPKPKPKPKQKPKKIKVKVEEEKVRKSALQVREDTKEQEKEFLEKEKIWETPAFLRKQA
jgi:cell division protein FtsZ